jgi:hypothetical protein
LVTVCRFAELDAVITDAPVACAPALKTAGVKLTVAGS